MNDILDFKGKPIRMVIENGEELYNILDVLEHGIGYKKPHQQLIKINKAIEENTALAPNWGNKEFSSKKGNRTVNQPVANYKQLIFILQFINKPEMIPFKLFVSEKLDKDKKQDNLFNLIASRETTPYRQRINNQKLKLGTPEIEIEIRTYNVKLNKALRDLISEEGFPGSIPKIQQMFGEVVLGVKPTIYRKENDISNSHHTREHCNHEQNRVFQFMEEELFKMIINHEGELTRRVLYKYAADCVQRGEAFIKLMDGYTLHRSDIRSNKQESLDYYIEVIKYDKNK